MNWGTMVAEIFSDTGRPSAESDKAKLAIVDAIDFHAHEPFWFMQQRFNFTTTAGVNAYGESTTGFPKGALTFLDDLLFLDVAGSADYRIGLNRVSMGVIDDRRARGGVSQSQPSVWTIWKGQIELWPTPELSTHVIRGRAYVTPGTPIKRYEGSAWKFYKPGTTSFVVGNEMTDDYPTGGKSENAWFVLEAGYQLIRWYAAYLLWTVLQKGASEAGQAQAALQRYAEVKAQLEDKNDRIAGPVDIEPSTEDW